MVLPNAAVQANYKSRFASAGKPLPMWQATVYAATVRRDSVKGMCIAEQALVYKHNIAGAAYLEQKLQVQALSALVLPHSNSDDAAQQCLHGKSS